MTIIVSVGSINADFVVRTEVAPRGAGSMLGTDFLRTSGGKAANVAVLATRLGTPAVLLGCVGDDDLAVQALRGPAAEGVDTTHVCRRAGPTGYSSVVVPADGAKSIVLAPNANEAWADQAASVRDLIAATADGAVVVVDLEIAPGLAHAALRAARARGLVTVVDPAPADRLDHELLSLADHLTPDHQEAEQLTGIDVGDVEGARRAAEALRRRGASVVHVKLSSGGCVTAAPEKVVVVEPPTDVDVVDATGAGDAFAGALAWALLAGRDVIAAAEVAVAAAACAVTGYGSQESYPTRAVLSAMVRRVRSTVLHPPGAI